MTIDVKRVAMVLSAATLFGAFAGAGTIRALPASTVIANPANAQDQAPPQGGPDERHLPLFGKITAMHDNSMDVLDTNGDTVSVKLTSKTEFRKDRQPAKRTDFKVGDIVLVRGEEAADHSWTAQAVASRSFNGGGAGGRGGFGGGPNGGGRGAQQGTLGKDYVAGEIKSIDAPKISVMRTDNVAQTLELNEETSLRKGRESITMADIQPGDHLIARGAVENNVFVPKTVIVIGAEQWKRMQEFGNQARGEGGGRRRQRGGQSQEGSSGSADSPAPNAAPPTPPSPNPSSPAPTPAPAPTPQLESQR